jgi:hypothetical protein
MKKQLKILGLLVAISLLFLFCAEAEQGGSRGENNSVGDAGSDADTDTDTDIDTDTDTDTDADTDTDTDTDTDSDGDSDADTDTDSDADTDTDSDSDSDTDSDSDSDTDSDADGPCTHDCLLDTTCSARQGTVHPNMECASPMVCCEWSGSGGDADTDADADSDSDTDSDSDSDTDSDSDSDTDSDSDSDTDADSDSDTDTTVCQVPSEANSDGNIDNPEDCANAKIIRRNGSSSLTTGEYGGNDGLYDYDGDDSSCASGSDNYFRIFLLAGETLIATKISCAWDDSNSDCFFALYKSNTPCTGVTCDTMISCTDMGTSIDHTATTDGWYHIVVDSDDSISTPSNDYSFSYSIH